VAGGEAAPAHIRYLADADRFAELTVICGSMSFRPAEHLVGRVLTERTPPVVPDLGRDAGFHRAAIAVEAGLAAVIAVPVLADDRVVAVLELFAEEAGEPGEDLLQLLTLVAAQLSAVFERARSSARLRAGDDRYRLLFEAGSDAVLGWQSPGGRIVDAKPAASRLTGRSRDELIGTSVWELIAPEWRDLARGHRARRIHDGGDTPYECAILDRAGLRVRVEITSSPFRDGDRVVGVHAIVRDITERQRFELELRESEDRFRHAFEASSVGMAFVSADGRWLKVNEALREILGYSAAELLELRLQDVTHPDDHYRDLEPARRMLAGELRTYQTEKRYLHKDGRVIWILFSASLIRGVGGEPAYFVSRVEDITERKRVELGTSELRARQSITGPLSPRERQVLALLAGGLTSGDAAERLAVSAETVQTHVRRAMSKLNARSRTQAVAVALQLGLIDDAGPDLSVAAGG